MQGHKVSTLPDDGALYKVRFALRKDTVEIYLDTSGAGLHKRGYRKTRRWPHQGDAGRRHCRPGPCAPRLVQDPFCGSGTLVIEAAQKALNLAPACAAALPPNISTLCPPTSGQNSARRPWTRSARMLLLRASATISTRCRGPGQRERQAGGRGDRCRFEVADVREFRALDNATVLTNPPTASASATHPRPQALPERWARSGRRTRAGALCHHGGRRF